MKRLVVCNMPLILLLSLFAGGCSVHYTPISNDPYKPMTLKEEHIDAENHMVTVNRDGGGIILTSPKTSNQQGVDLDSDAFCKKDPFTGHIKKLLKSIKDSNRKDIVLFTHGGLNLLDGSVERSAEHTKLIKGDSNSSIYPIYINWISGPFATYGDHLGRIRHGEVSSFAWASSIVYLPTDIGLSLVNAPKSWIVTGVHSVKSVFSSFDENTWGYYTNQKPESIWRSLGSATWWGLTSPFKLATTPFAYTVGRPAWDMMKRRIQTLFHKPLEFNGDQINSCDQYYAKKEGTGSLAIFLHELSEFIKKEKTSYTVTLIGHSMGAIVSGEVIDRFPEIKFKNIVFMAAASTIKDYIQKVKPYLEKNTETHFYNLSLHPKAEDKEITAKGFMPSGSLLVYIDQFYDDPNTQLDRTFGRWDNIKHMEETLRTKNTNTHFKIFSFGDNEPKKHGDFSQKKNGYKYWDPTFWWKDSTTFDGPNG